MTSLLKASAQWATRPADERYDSLESLHAAAVNKRAASIKATAALRDLKADVLDGQVILTGKEGRQANFTNWSFGQIAKAADAPASYLRTLPAPLAAECINTGLARAETGKKESLLLRNDGDHGLTLHAATSESYSRIWNSAISERLLELQANGPWQPAPPAFGGSRGLYLGDRDMFCFMVDNNRRIFEKLPGGGLSRGFFVWNSEVGSASFGVMTFLYVFICGNHQVHGAKEIREVRLRHVGDANGRAFRDLQVSLRKYADSSAHDDELRIEAARNFIVGANKDEILDKIFGLRIPDLTRRVIGQAYDLAEKRVDWYGNPRSAWGMSSAVTEIARDLPNANERHALERAGSKIAEMAF